MSFWAWQNQMFHLSFVSFIMGIPCTLPFLADIDFLCPNPMKDFFQLAYGHASFPIMRKALLHVWGRGHGMAKGQELGMVPRWQMEAAFHTSRFDTSILWIHTDVRNILLYLYMDGISHLYIIHTDYGVCFTIVSLNVCMLYACAYWFTYLCGEILILPPRFCKQWPLNLMEFSHEFSLNHEYHELFPGVL